MLDFVIWAPRYTDLSGGVIVLHTLCARLNALGYKAAMWPDLRSVRRGDLRSRASWIVKEARRWHAAEPFSNPVASWEDALSAVVVYPETVVGNPLGTPVVARWLLHRPGFHTGTTGFLNDDIFFFHEDAFNTLDLPPDRRLALSYVNPVYRDDGSDRSGSCYLMRKGKDREIEHDLAESICVDGLGHAETAAVFKTRERLYSYDPYTMLNHYAALSGCIPIVMPPADMTADEWLPNEAERAGIAWGPTDVARAIATRPLLVERFRHNREIEDEQVGRFATICLSARARVAANATGLTCTVGAQV